MSIVQWNRYMTHLRQAERYMDVVRVLYAMPCPDKVSFNIAIDSLGKSRQFHLMENTLVHMIDRGCAPDVRTFTSMLSAYMNARHGVAVLHTLDFMRERGVQPNKYTMKIIDIWERSTIGNFLVSDHYE